MSTSRRTTTDARRGLGNGRWIWARPELHPALLTAGWRVAAAGRREEALRETLAETTGQCIAVPADVTVPESVAGLFAATGRRGGRLDLLVNNAGIFGPAGGIDEISYEDWQATVATNLTGAFLCAGQAVRIMKAQSPPGGRIINIGSLSARTPRPGSAAYTATKHAITGLTKSPWMADPMASRAASSTSAMRRPT